MVREPTDSPSASGKSAEPARPSETSGDGFGKIVRRLGPASVLAVITVSLPAIGGVVLLSFRLEVAGWLQAQPDGGLAMYIGAFILLAGCSLLPTYSQALIGGFVFRFGVGFPAVLIGFGGACLLAYWIARVVARDRATRLIAEHPRWQAVYDALLGGGFWKALAIVALLRFAPNSPFAATNLVLAATKVRMLPYILGTLMGMAPRTAAVVYVGSHLKDLSDADTPGWYFWAGVVLTLAVLGLVGLIINWALSQASALPLSGAATGPTGVRPRRP